MNLKNSGRSLLLKKTGWQGIKGNKNMERKNITNSIEKYEYLGYIFMSNGSVYTPTGKKAAIWKDPNGYDWVTIRTKSRNGKTSVRKICIAKVLYSFYHPDQVIDRKHTIGFKDGDSSNYACENLFLKNADKKTGKRPDNIKSRRRALTEDQVLSIQNLYSNHDKHFRSQWNKDSYSIRDLAQKYEVSIYTIQKVIAGCYHGEEKNNE